MKNLKISGNLQVGNDIINNKTDYQLDQTITVTDQSKIFIPVNFNKYDYKLVMLLAPKGGDANTSIRCANNNVILQRQDRWIFQGNGATDSNTSSAVTWYRHQTNDGNGYMYLIDNVGAEGRYSDIKVELTWGRNSNNTIFYQSRASRTYANNFEYKDASGMMFGDSGLPNQLVVTNSSLSDTQLFNGYIRVYKRLAFGQTV